MNALERLFVPIHTEGHAPLLASALVALVGFFIWWPIALVGGLSTIVCLFAFRDPERMTPLREGLIVSPADGIIIQVDEAVPPADLDLGEQALPRIAISIGLFDVHVNRIPVDGVVAGTSYRPGAYRDPTHDKASEENERQMIRIRTADEGEVGIVQIAGFIARRIVATVSQGDAVKAGERFGLIRFGSRVDVYLPSGTTLLVAPGQRAVGGETVLADFRSEEGARPAQRR